MKYDEKLQAFHVDMVKEFWPFVVKFNGIWFAQILCIKNGDPHYHYPCIIQMRGPYIFITIDHGRGISGYPFEITNIHTKGGIVLKTSEDIKQFLLQ